MDYKQQVEQYIATDRTLLGGRNLYNKLPGISRAMQNSFSRMRETPEAIDKICYELAKLVGIPPRNLTILMQKPVVAVKAAQKKKVKAVEQELSTDDKLLAFNPDTSDYKTSKALVKELKLKVANQKKATVFKALAEARKKLVGTKLQELPEQVKQSLKLRDQFPFLRQPDCPDVLKILVNELITAYENFKAAQPRLHELLVEAEEKAVVATVKDNYISNKQAWDELEYYKKNGKVLGNHPIFKELKAKEAIAAMSTPDLTKKINTLTANISRNKQKGNTDLVQRDEVLLAYAKNVLEKR